MKKIIEIVKKAGSAAMNFYDDPQVSLKEDLSPVTKADTASENVLLNELKQFGDCGFLSEESFDDKSRLDKKFIWIIDPLDGTSDFIQKTGEFSVMVGLVNNSEPILGIVHLPASNSTYFGQKGGGAYLMEGEKESRIIHVNMKNEISKASLVVSRNHLSKTDRIIAKEISNNFVQAGSNGVKMCKIAEGKVDLFFNTGTDFGEEDCCAPQVILTEAGGQVTDTNGKDLMYNKINPKLQHGIAASNGLLHDDLIDYILKRK
jgi:3'(2'), 5'-bisphosphate nucleotidase